MFPLIVTSQVSNPKDIPGLNVWLDSTVGTLASNGTPVTAFGGQIFTWQDQSGNGNDVIQPSGTLTPRVGPTQNGLRTISFNGTNQHFRESGTGAAQLTGGRKLYIFAALKFNTYSGTATIYPIAKSGGYASSTGTSGFFGVRRWNKSSFGGTQGFYEMQINVGGGVWEYGNGPFTSTAFHYTAITMPRTTVRPVTAQMFINEELFGQRTNVTSNNTPTANTVMRLSIGCALSGTAYTPQSYLNGQIGEICIYTPTADLTQTQISGLRRYFKNKWGV